MASSRHIGSLRQWIRFYLKIIPKNDFHFFQNFSLTSQTNETCGDGVCNGVRVCNSSQSMVGAVCSSYGNEVDECNSCDINGQLINTCRNSHFDILN